jgi:hypothetical protein
MWYGLRVPTAITPLVALGRPDAANLRAGSNWRTLGSRLFPNNFCISGQGRRVMQARIRRSATKIRLSFDVQPWPSPLTPVFRGCDSCGNRLANLCPFGRSMAGWCLRRTLRSRRSTPHSGAGASRPTAAGPTSTTAYSIAAWMREADPEGRLPGFLDPSLSVAERAAARAEG